ncbi:hypothetical protein HDU91_003832 [Kappamyces sp. JEL0680]|nr:hypothetical protein HDU91_003832 [Kappamyces sp. JEL0680]
MFLARHIPSGQNLSLKLTDLNLSLDYEFIHEVMRNVENNKLLKNPNILPNLLTFVEEDELWTATLPQIGTLREIMKEHFPEGLSEAGVATILKEVLKGLQYIHDNHMIHNDIRADNIFIDSHGDVRLGGFRQMTVLQRSGQLSETAFSLIGDNIEWAAPEIMTQNSNFGISADIYSLGITALEIAYNKTPFDNWPPLKVLLCKQKYECPAIKSPKLFSKHFFQFVSLCVQKDPALRPRVHVLLEHPFIKQAKSTSYLESLLLKSDIASSNAQVVANTAGAGTPNIDYESRTPDKSPSMVRP